METDDPKAVLDDPKLRAAVAQATWNRAHAALILEAQRKSGLTVRDFARQLGVKSWRLYKWRRRLRPDKAPAAPPMKKAALPTGIVPLRIAAPTPKPAIPAAPTVEIRHPCGLRIRFSHPPAESFFQHLLQILVPLC